MSNLSEWRKLTRHPLSEAWGDMSEVEFEGLLADMKQHGYDNKQQVILYENKVLDGWNRLRAAVMTDKVPTFENYSGDDPVGFVHRRNGLRRHLTPSQLGIIASRLTECSHGGKRNGQIPNLSLEKVAKTLGISRGTAYSGKKVTDEGSKELQDAVVDGTLSVADAAAVVEEPKPKQNKAVRAVKSGKAKTAKEAVSKFDEADTEEPAEPTIDDEIKTKNSIIESFCRSLMKLVDDDTPKDVWLDDMGRRDAAIQKFKDGCTTLRSAKCHGPCPKCNGDGCAKCKKTGRVPKLVHDQLL